MKISIVINIDKYNKRYKISLFNEQEFYLISKLLI